MNAPLCSTVLSLSILGLTACASSTDKTTYAQPARVVNPGEGGIELDSEYMAYVERIARRRGIVVQWLHPPTKRVAASQ